MGRVSRVGGLRHHLFWGVTQVHMSAPATDTFDNGGSPPWNYFQRWILIMGPRVLALTNMSAKLIVTNIFPLTCLYQQKWTQHFRRWLSGTAGADANMCFKFTTRDVHTMMNGLGLGLGQSGLFGLWSVFALGKHPMSSWALPAACVYDPLFSSQQYVISFLQWVHLELQLLFFGGFGGYFWGSRGLGGST